MIPQIFPSLLTIFTVHSFVSLSAFFHAFKIHFSFRISCALSKSQFASTNASLQSFIGANVASLSCFNRFISIPMFVFFDYKTIICQMLDYIYFSSSFFISSCLSKASTSSSKDVHFVCKSSDEIFSFVSAISFSMSEDWSESESDKFCFSSSQVDFIHNSNKSRNHPQIPAGSVNATFFESLKYFQLNAFAKLQPRIHNRTTKTTIHIILINGIKEISTTGSIKIHNHIDCFR
ncbi:hypothetical protein J5751_07250 [bacterium]|nr:hypothetical protein [bacterium]